MRSLVLIVALSACVVSAAERLDVRVLSSRTDMVTGGDALLQVTGASVDSLRVRLNGKRIEVGFLESETGTLPARIEGLRLGSNSLVVKSKNQRRHIKLVNHPRTGPVFSGPHQTPFHCQTEAAGLGSPLDAQCSAETRVDYFYKSTQELSDVDRSKRGPVPPGFKPFDPSEQRPADLAQTRTKTGKTVDYIVRRETGTINRAIYQIAFLHEPGSPLPNPGARGDVWNGRLVYRFGGGCRAGYRQGRLSSAMTSASLAKGYAVAASSLNVFGNNCDDVISAETLMMVKEHFIESFGVPVHTIGAGGSGGSMQQHLIAQNYPGLLDGITPTSSYSDIVTLVAPVTDCTLLAGAFSKSTLEWAEEQKAVVSGYATWKTCGSWMRFFSPGWINAKACPSPVSDAEVYDANSNPDGVRCGLHDNQVNIYGRNSKSGFTPRTLDNVGVQYGLAAFNTGKISAQQFLELNELMGGYDQDGQVVPTRSVADPEALKTAYRKGRVNSGGGSLGSIPIIDARPYRDLSGDIHDRIRTFVTETRLAHANGNAGNRVVLTNHGTHVNLIEKMDEWLTTAEQDTAAGTAREKIVRNKPAHLKHACWTSGGEELADTGNDSGRCSEIYPNHGDPRLAAGASLTNDVLKCTLKPIDAADYERPLAEAQLDRLAAIFPSGVCDYNQPGVGQSGIEGTWLRYGK